MFELGTKLPEFNLADQGGKIRSRADLTGPKGLVLFVYSRDNTSGCTTEASEFQALLADFRKAGYGVAGISKDKAESHAKFAAKLGLDYPLLADQETTTLQTLGAWVEKKSKGKVSMVTQRSTFVANADGVVTKVYPKVKAAGHARAVLDELTA